MEQNLHRKLLEQIYDTPLDETILSIRMSDSTHEKFVEDLKSDGGTVGEPPSAEDLKYGIVIECDESLPFGEIKLETQKVAIKTK